ncbi:hypothetical protein AYJ57_21795 (plasmid) [Salipiger sp. CCB-MM3]|uniref:hypothetical protein n=1 Tax=Salipiger sp. CCB-MM3 TaxID=1792508 RepID=UPI00080AB1FD|nr:hypothetical protein [Salipiger sp. CCB-MM3]ANT63105.1 hypothetical protein AYJ57_21795 [Salipiger sp. CCB-MM3]
MTSTLQENVSARLRYVEEIAAALEVSDNIKQVVAKEIDGTRFTPESLHREWLNHTCLYKPDDPIRLSAMKSPDVSYFKFAEKRAKEPDMPAPHIVRTLVKQYGVIGVMQVREFIWPRQIEWATALQAHPDDDVVLYATYFLREATSNDCDESFKGLVKFYEEIIEPGLYETVRRFDLEEEEVMAADVADLQIFPSCIEYMRWKRADKNAKMPTTTKEKAAEAIRRQYELSEEAEKIAALQEWYRSHPLYQNDMIIPEACKAGLKSDELLQVHEEFLKSFSTDGVPKNGETPELRFMSMMTGFSREKRSLPPVSNAEYARRKSDISGLSHTWSRKLTDSHLTLEGGDASTFNQWQTQTLNGERPLPENWLLDYHLFLFERLSA